jgi:predicted transcriptional regulator
MPRSKCHLMLTTTNYVLGILFKFYLKKQGFLVKIDGNQIR